MGEELLTPPSTPDERKHIFKKILEAITDFQLDFDRLTEAAREGDARRMDTQIFYLNDCLVDLFDALIELKRTYGNE